MLASNTKEVGVVFADGIVSVAVPARQITDWHSTDQVGISAAVDVYQSDLHLGDVRSGTKLEVLIEKDFRCLDVDVVEDQSDMFENPLRAHVVC